MNERKKLKMRRKKRILLWLFFIAYLLVLFYVVFFAEQLGRSNTGRYRSCNLVLFGEIRRFLKYRHILGTKIVFMNLAGNILVFLPFGFMLPVLCRFFHRLFGVLLAGFCLSFVIETLQLYFYVGSFDVDDLLLNTLGSIIGYACLRIFERIK
jgi:glycopeptide antibiotics resistance protein